ncbi:MAG TPA: hypothetical protein VHL53_17965, partial [Acidimicrobiia bacterium]|nr:hypothetical protein [Acidimicrobiia bacterium]
ITLARDVGGTGGSALHDSYEVRNAMPVNAFYDATGTLRFVAPGQYWSSTPVEPPASTAVITVLLSSLWPWPKATGRESPTRN